MQDDLEELARKVQRLDDGLCLLPDEEAVKRQVKAINRRIAAINSRLASDDPFEPLDSERLVRTWGKMYRARPSPLRRRRRSK